MPVFTASFSAVAVTAAQDVFEITAPTSGTAFTVTIATPGVVTATAHGLPTGNKIRIWTSSALPTGLTAGSEYFVERIDADTFYLSSTLNGPRIATSGSQTGVHHYGGHAETQRVRIREVRLGQYTDFGDAAAEMLSVLIVTGYTTAGTGGSTLTPTNVARHAGAPTAGSTVLANNTTVATNGTGTTILADAWNIQAGWWYKPVESDQIILRPGQKLVVRITAPADSLTMNGTLTFEEM